MELALQQIHVHPVLEVGEMKRKETEKAKPTLSIPQAISKVSMLINKHVSIIVGDNVVLHAV